MDVLLLTTARLVPNHSQSHAATPPRRPIFDSPLRARLDHHERERESVKATCQGSRSSRSHARLDLTRNPDGHVPPCTVNSPKPY